MEVRRRTFDSSGDELKCIDKISTQASMMKWLDKRLNVRALMASLFAHPVPKRSNFLDYLGFATLFIFISQAVTGILLAMVYKPSATEAYASIQAIQASTIGNFVRSLHSWSADFMVILVVLHLLRVFYVGAYKRPRELTWVMGGVLFVGTLGSSFTGYLLPWDQEGYWATTVGSAMAGFVPFFGDFLVNVLRGGAQVSGATLTRFYSGHMLVLPVIILLAFMPHFFFVLRQGMSSTDELTKAQHLGEDISKKSSPFWPNVAFKMIITVLVVFIASWVLAGIYPKGLGAPADALNKMGYLPEPAWYFFGVYQYLKYFPGQLDVLAIVGIPIIFFVVFFAFPWIDRNPSRSPSKRPIALGSAAILVVSMIFLTYQGMSSVPKALADTGVVDHPSYKNDVRPILKSKCITCHADIVRFTKLMERVSAGNPAESILINRIDGSEEPLMPIEEPLSKNQVQTITNWIQDGAKNN